MLAYYDAAPSSASSASSSSSSSSSPPPLRHRFIPKRSPSPSTRHVPHRPYSPSSREADIARLLDPAYASPAPYSPLGRSPRMAVKEVYVDHHGDLHDPDFRDFPPFGHSHLPSRRPQWERPYADNNDDDDDSDDETSQLDQPRRTSFEPHPRRASSTTTYRPSPVYYPYEEPASYESRLLAEDLDEEVDQLERAPLKEKPFYRCPRSPIKLSKGQDEKRAPSAAEGGQHVVQVDSEWTPTCTQNLRRQWQAITLSLRFSLFRTKRRLRRRMTG